MKIRTSFVTNSSSSSYVVVYKVDYNDQLRDYLKEEFGKYGIRLAEEYICKGKYLKESDEYRYEYLDDIEDEEMYLACTRISWTDEGDTEGDDAWLADHIPSRYIERVYEGDAG